MEVSSRSFRCLTCAPRPSTTQGKINGKLQGSFKLQATSFKLQAASLELQAASAKPQGQRFEP
jgi:hypothetical protein